MMNNDEQTKEYENIFLLFDFRRRQQRRKKKIELFIWSHKITILQFLILYIKISSMTENILPLPSMSPERFSHLLSLVQERILKKDTRFRKSISAEESLALTLSIKWKQAVPFLFIPYW